MLNTKLARDLQHRVAHLAAPLDVRAAEQVSEVASALPASHRLLGIVVDNRQDGADAIEPASQPRCAPDQGAAALAAADRDQHILRSGPDGSPRAPNRLCHQPKRDLAQRSQVARSEEVGEGRLHLVRCVHVAVAHPLAQGLRRDVDELDLVGLVEHSIGEGLAHGDARDVLRKILDRFEVLHVDGGDHVDARREDLLDVLVALLVAHAGRIGVGELVHKSHLRMARQHGVEIHLFEDAALIVDVEPRDDLEVPNGLLA